MSASREKKTRHDPAPQDTVGATHQKNKELAQQRNAGTQYFIVGTLCVLLAIVAFVWNLGVFQSRAIAATMKGEKYPVSVVQYYFNTAKQNTINTYYQYIGSAPFDTNTTTKNQIYNQETGATWYDQLMTQALDNLESTVATYDRLQSEGYTLSEEGRETYESVLEQINTGWKEAGFPNRNAYMRAIYGKYMTYDNLMFLLNRDITVSDYMSSTLQGFEFSDEEFAQYYQENAKNLDQYTLSVMTLRVQVDTTDADGNEIEMTDEELAQALDDLKAEKLVIAKDIQTRLNGGESFAALAERYAEELTGEPSIETELVGSNVTSMPYGEWASDDVRKSGDITLYEDEISESSYAYYIVAFHDRHRDDTPTATVRHMLIAAEVDEDATTPTEEQYAAAKEKAEQLLAQWNTEGATEEQFAELAKEHSADKGSAEDGGLISNIHKNSGYVSTFSNWVLDPARTSGDTGIVQNTGSATKGWHIMYFVGNDGLPVWKQTAENAMREKAFSAWTEDTQDGYLAFPRQFGQKFIAG